MGMLLEEDWTARESRHMGDPDSKLSSQDQGRQRMLLKSLCKTSTEPPWCSLSSWQGYAWTVGTAKPPLLLPMGCIYGSVSGYGTQVWTCWAHASVAYPRPRHRAQGKAEAESREEELCKSCTSCYEKKPCQNRQC